MYRIGDFSKLVEVPVKTLRYYDEINLFKPIDVDLFTGYRYYSKEQIDDIKIILELKDIGFSLDEIKNNWNHFNEGVMLNKRNELLNEIRETKEKIKKLDRLREKIVGNKIQLHEKDKLKQKDLKILERGNEI